jgi:toxin-antitoxin system PIN domain toxin
VSASALLDVNVLVALFNPDHVHHDVAHDWFANARAGGWATCAVTEQGLLRILANPSFWSEFARTAALIKRLRQFCGSGNHRFWDQTVSLRDRTLFDLSHLSGHRQITDVYLLGLAHRMGGRLATFDRTIPLKAVIGATGESLVILGQIAESTSSGPN